MRTNFQDWEDKLLVQIALQFEQEGLRITWDYVERRMARMKRTARVLQLRLTSLKRTYGKRVRDFPPCFFGSTKPGCIWNAPATAGSRPARRRPANTDPSTTRRPSISAQSARAAQTSRCSSCVPPVLPLATRSPSTSEPPAKSKTELDASKSAALARLRAYEESLLALSEAAQAIATIFDVVSARDVRQQAGRMYGNAGEVLPAGVAAMIDAMGPFTSQDIFLDIGAGIGNVLAQVALTSHIKACIGIEVRTDLSELGMARIEGFVYEYPLLRKVSMITGDVADIARSSKAPVCDSTIVFTNNLLFEEPVKLVLSRELNSMPRARVVAVSCQFCPQHRSTCVQPFCATWRLIHTIEVPCSWKSTAHYIYIHRRYN